jgi:hypothetical protein
MKICSTKFKTDRDLKFGWREKNENFVKNHMILLVHMRCVRIYADLRTILNLNSTYYTVETVPVFTSF